MLPKGLSALLDTLFAMPEITRKCAMWLLEGGDPMSLETMYTTWCNGQGMLITVHTQEEADKVIATMKQFDIEAQVAGHVIETPKNKKPNLNISTVDLEGNDFSFELSK